MAKGPFVIIRWKDSFTNNLRERTYSIKYGRFWGRPEELRSVSSADFWELLPNLVDKLDREEKIEACRGAMFWWMHDAWEMKRAELKALMARRGFEPDIIDAAEKELVELDDLHYIEPDLVKMNPKRIDRRHKRRPLPPNLV